MDLSRDGVDSDDDATQEADETTNWDFDDEDINKIVRNGKQAAESETDVLDCGLLIEEVPTAINEWAELNKDPDAKKVSDLVEDMRDGKPGSDTLKLFSGLDFGKYEELFDSDKEYALRFLEKVNKALRSSTELTNEYRQLSVNSKGELVVETHHARAGSAPLVQTYKLPTKK